MSTCNILDTVGGKNNATPAASHFSKTKENKHFFYFFRPTQKMPGRAPNEAGKIFFRLIQTLPTFWAERIWILRIPIFWIFRTPHFWISRFPDLQIPRFPGPQISKFPNSQISRFPDFQTPPAAPAPALPDELSDPNLTPLPTHPGIKYVAGSPCCDKSRAGPEEARRPQEQSLKTSHHHSTRA